MIGDKLNSIVKDLKVIGSDLVHLFSHLEVLIADCILFWKDIKSLKKKVEKRLKALRKKL